MQRQFWILMLATGAKALMPNDEFYGILLYVLYA